MAPPKEILTFIYHNGHIIDDLVQGSVYICANPIFIYVICSITLTQLIRKINNCLPTRATEKVSQLLFHYNDDLKGAMETIIRNLQLNYVEFYVVTDLIPQPQLSSPQPSCPQLQLPPS